MERRFLTTNVIKILREIRKKNVMNYKLWNKIVIRVIMGICRSKAIAWSDMRICWSTNLIAHYAANLPRPYCFFAHLPLIYRFYSPFANLPCQIWAFGDGAERRARNKKAFFLGFFPPPAPIEELKWEKSFLYVY